jgi:hypothetical protein
LGSERDEIIILKWISRDGVSMGAGLNDLAESPIAGVCELSDESSISLKTEFLDRMRSFQGR